MRYYFVLIVALLFILSSCTKDSLDIQTIEKDYKTLNHTTLHLDENNEFKAKDPGCCWIDVEATQVSFTNICCTYEISIVNHRGCPLYVQGPKGTFNNFENGLDGSMLLEVCANADGMPQSNEILIYWVTGTGNVIVCETLYLNSACIECDFTFEQGFTTGCTLAGGDDVLCCEQSSECSSEYVNTIEEFQFACPEYVQGVIAGWEACCDQSGSGTGTGGGGNGTVLCGGEPLPDDAFYCDCVNEEWVNCIY